MAKAHRADSRERGWPRLQWTGHEWVQMIDVDRGPRVMRRQFRGKCARSEQIHHIELTPDHPFGFHPPRDLNAVNPALIKQKPILGSCHYSAATAIATKSDSAATRRSRSMARISR
jgi:hypothetical protein